MTSFSDSVDKPYSKLSESETNIPHQEKIGRDWIFARFDKPLGLEQHVANRFFLFSFHCFGIFYSYTCLAGITPQSTVIFELIYGYLGGLSVTIGSHRLWSHRAFSAKAPIKWILMILQTTTFQYPLFKWECSQELYYHRAHHKFTDSEGDPHSAAKGLWFSHMGWLLQPKHPELEKKLKEIDMTDLENDPVVRFQSKNYWILIGIFYFFIPISITWYFWRIPLVYCFASNCRRFIFTFHISASVNSFAHAWGYRPYDENLSAVENPIVSFFAVGEGWHNWHHTFPWDYRASEFGCKLNISTLVIDSLAKLGLVYNLKTVSKNVLESRKDRTGERSESKCDKNK